MKRTNTEYVKRLEKALKHIESTLSTLYKLSKDPEVDLNSMRGAALTDIKRTVKTVEIHA